MENESGNSKQGFEENIREKTKRKIKARKDRQKGVWFGIGMFGLVGWSVTIPALLFLALGIWIDSTYQGQYSWTLMLLIVGIAIGCLNAWYWVKSESQGENDDNS